MMQDRRDTVRVPDNRLITEIIDDKPNAASVINMSGYGLYTIKASPRAPRGPRIIQLEIPVPEASDSIWAMGEIVFERVGMSCVGAGIRLLNMADRHYSLLKDMVEYRRQEILQRMMTGIKWRKDLAKSCTPFTSKPQALTEDTVRMYLLDVTN
ncbi:MAG: PilZ domain-containing protein [Deltaproteobacteria bacterium]|nr:PilZ domain-containing protein [Deltaproteobacteria bacterium]